MKVTGPMTALFIAVLLVGALVTVLPLGVSQATTSQRFGFGFIGIRGLIQTGYTPQTFFKGYFLTSPYPSTVQLMLNNGIQEITNTVNVNFMLSLMQQASVYPNIKLGLSVAFDITNTAQWTGFINSMNTFHNSPYSSSIGFVGFAVEQLNIVDGGATGTAVDNAFSRAGKIITGDGWAFVSYYPQGWKGTPSNKANYQFTAHTNYPTGDLQTSLNDGLGSTNIVGQTIGSDGLQIFPSVGCTTVFGAGNPKYNLPAWSTQSFAQGFLGSGYNNRGPCYNIITLNGFPPTIAQALSAAAYVPAFNRQWVLILAGNSANGYGGLSTCGCSYAYKIGASGVSSHFLWDNLAFRQAVTNWITGHRNVFLTGNGAAVSSSPILKTSSTSSSASMSAASTTTTTSASVAGK